MLCEYQKSDKDDADDGLHDAQSHRPQCKRNIISSLLCRKSEHETIQETEAEKAFSINGNEIFKGRSSGRPTNRLKRIDINQNDESNYFCLGLMKKQLLNKGKNVLPMVLPSHVTLNWMSSRVEARHLMGGQHKRNSKGTHRRL